jgi:hypothetical protein
MGRLGRKSGTASDLVKGAIAGAVATGVMDKLTGVLYEGESKGARRQEDRARGGKTAYEVAADKAAGLVGTHITDEDRHRYGNAVHWSLGIAAGAAYAVLRHKIPGLRRAGGAKFGMAFWAAVDEGVVSILGLTPPPQAFPVQTHARGFVGHLVFGIVADRTLRVLDAVA